MELPPNSVKRIGWGSKLIKLLLLLLRALALINVVVAFRGPNPYYKVAFCFIQK